MWRPGAAQEFCVMHLTLHAERGLIQAILPLIITKKSFSKLANVDELKLINFLLSDPYLVGGNQPCGINFLFRYRSTVICSIMFRQPPQIAVPRATPRLEYTLNILLLVLLTSATKL